MIPVVSAGAWGRTVMQEIAVIRLEARATKQAGFQQFGARVTGGSFFGQPAAGRVESRGDRGRDRGLVAVEFAPDATGRAMAIEVTAETLGRTGVEMEALTAAAVGLLTIYDMCKAVDRGMRIEDVRLLEKSGGKSGHFKAG